jgi:hypothetical protein
MKQQIERLLAMDLDPELFYNITIWGHELRLQGFGSQSLFRKLKSLEYKFDFDYEYGWLRAEKDGIFITLTYNNL